MTFLIAPFRATTQKTGVEIGLSSPIPAIVCSSRHTHAQIDIYSDRVAMVCKVSVREVRIMEEVRAPIPGKILAIKCKVNDFIKPGQVLLILEAMKMENEICSDSSGVVKEVKVKEGDFVQSGFTLIVIGEGKNKN